MRDGVRMGQEKSMRGGVEDLILRPRPAPLPSLLLPPPQPPKSAHNYPRKSTHNHKNKTHRTSITNPTIRNQKNSMNLEKLLQKGVNEEWKASAESGSADEE